MFCTLYKNFSIEKHHNIFSQGFMSPLVIDMATSPSSSDTQSISNLSNVGNSLSNQGNTQHGNSSSSNSSRRENSVQTAEHKRRLNIKLAFEKLQGLIPMQQQQDGSVSKKIFFFVNLYIILCVYFFC